MTVEDPERADRDRVRRSALAVALWLLVPLLVVAAYVAQILESFSAVGCEGDCDLALAFGARAVFPWAVAVSVIAAIVAAFMLRHRRKPAYWAPLLGVVLVLVSAITTSAVFQAGLAPMYARNDRIANGEVPAETTPPLPDPVGGWEASVDGATFLSFSPDGTVTGSDGCNDLSGRWSQDSAGRIELETLLPQTENACDGIDAWLGRGAIRGHHRWLHVRQRRG